MSARASRVSVEVGGRTLSLSNLGKVLYPQTGTTKAEVVDYYRRVAPVLLPHLRDRPLTVVRFPDGVGGGGFFTKNAPAHRPDWIRTARLASPGSTKDRDVVDYLVVSELAALVWVANLAAIELHTPMWRVGASGAARPDLVVADLDPGPPATVVDCARVALALREPMGALVEGPLCVKTSGSKGLQVYGRLAGGRTGMQARDDMRAVAQALARAHPGLVVSNMRKDLRPGKVLLDWSQNNPAKTTVTVYSLRARPTPTASTPLAWAEVAAARQPADLAFTAEQALARVDEHGDLFAPLAGGAPGGPPGGPPGAAG
jgi:bifunctional non-homologous end joining protein LigD